MIYLVGTIFYPFYLSSFHQEIHSRLANTYEAMSPSVLSMQTGSDHPHLTFPDIGYQKSLFPSVIPGIGYRESIFASFQIDPCHKHAGMTNGGMDPCQQPAGMTKGRWIPATDTDRKRLSKFSPVSPLRSHRPLPIPGAGHIPWPTGWR